MANTGTETFVIFSWVLEYTWSIRVSGVAVTLVGFCYNYIMQRSKQDCPALKEKQ